jgi:hypothetical protein
VVGQYHSDHGLRTLAFDRRHGTQTDLSKCGDVGGNRQRGLEPWVPCRDRGEPVMVVARGNGSLIMDFFDILGTCLMK